MRHSSCMTTDKLDGRGFTLIELVVIIVALGIISIVAIPKLGVFGDQAKITATREEMLRLKIAIVGDPAVTAGGAYVNRGYYGDVGALPVALADLAIKPGAVPVFNSFTRRGWNGPYIDSAGGAYLTDAWSATYSYSSAGRTITSTGSGSSIVVGF